MLFYQAVSKAYQYLRETRTNTAVSEEEMKSLVNQGYQNILSMRNWDFLQETGRLSFPVTILSAGADAGDETVTVVSAAGFVPGMEILLETKFQTAKIKAVSGNTITLTEELAEDVDSGAKVSGYTAFLPDLLRHIWKTKYNGYSLSSMSGADFFENIAEYSFGNPVYYLVDGYDNTRHPASGFLSAGTSSDTSVSCSLLTQPDDYFTGWLLVNVTRKSEARVAGFADGVLTLESPIDDQNTGDQFFLLRKKQTVKVWPAPETSLKIDLIYFRDYPDMVNDYDELVIPDRFCHLAALYACVAALYGDEGRAVELNEKKNQLAEGIALMKKTQEKRRDRTIRLVSPGFCV